MSVEFRNAGPDDIAAVADFLHRQMNSALSPAEWRRIMDYPWAADKPDLGVVATDGGRVIGFMGKIFARREIDGGAQWLCNMSSVYVDARYRGRGIATEIHRAVIADPTVTYYVFNLSPNVRQVTTKPELGFRVLDELRYVWHASGATHRGVEVISDAEAVAPLLAPAERRLVEDHAAFPVAPHLLAAGGDQCLVFTHRRQGKRGGIYHEAMHVSNAPLLAAHAQAFADWLLAGTDATLMVDSRFLRGHTTTGELRPLTFPRFFKSSRLQAADIDYLYSEIPLLA